MPGIQENRHRRIHVKHTICGKHEVTYALPLLLFTPPFYQRGLEILATLSGIRIPVASIKFTGKTPQDSGTFADVAMATLVLGGHCGPRARKVAAKRLRFIDSMTEEKFCCVSLSVCWYLQYD